MTRWRGGIGLSVCVAALAAGLMSNVLGPTGQVNLLAFPLLGLLAWNLLVYVWMVAGRGMARRAARRARQAGAAGGPLIRWTVRFVSAHDAAPPALPRQPGRCGSSWAAH